MLTLEKQKSLVQQAKQGDSHAMETLIRAYLRASYAVALAVVGRPADAEDVAQDAFVRAMERLDTCRDDAKFGGWLLQIVRNRARNHLAWRRLRDIPKDSTPKELVSPGNAPELALRTELLNALDVLSPVQREVVLLHDLEGWTHPEIADTLGISAVMSRQHLFHSRRIVRNKLDDNAQKLRGVS